MSLQQNSYRIGNPALLREINLSVIINHLKKNAPTSRAALAKATGLTKATVSSLVSELLKRGFVRETGLEAGITGRPSMSLEINPEAGSIVSGELGVDFISVICTNFACEVIWRQKESIHKDMGQQVIIDRLLALFREGLQAGGELCAPPLGLALGAVGPIDPPTGMLMLAPNLGWRKVPLGYILRDSFDEPVFVYNDSYFGALGECHLGAGEGYNEMLYVAAAIGLGGAIVYNGSLFGGTVTFPGRFGHMTVDPDGQWCGCGNRGCWETQVSHKTLLRLVRQALDQGRSSSLASLENGIEDSKLTVERVLEAAEAGDRVALEALTQIGHDLGVGVASLINALNPEVVVLGNMLSVAGEFLLPPMFQELKQHVLCWDDSPTKVVLGQHGYDACVMGGVVMVRQSILPMPDTVLRRPLPLA